MLQQVCVEKKSLRDYAPLVGEDAIEEIYRLARDLQGARVLHLNATAFGGGVAEILASLVPLLNDVGLVAEWRVMYGSDTFFCVTKDLHNGLQGKELTLSDESRQVYIEMNRLNAEAFDREYDFVIVHDPQPAAMLHFLSDRGLGKHWIWRCHIDTSRPNPIVLDFLKPFLEQYDAAIFTLPRFAPELLRFPRLFFVRPTIDPLSPKNIALTPEETDCTLRAFRVDPSRPLITQVSRFDPWKDPLGVIDAYRMIKSEMPNVQLALVGSMATDDPEGWDYYERTVRHAGNDYDIHILHNLHGVGSREVNAFQRGSDVVVQKSTREGFGLVVAEALWKERAVVAGNVGGIPLQIIDGVTGYLVEDKVTCAERVYRLLASPDQRQRFGQSGREHIRKDFLSPRHVKDYLALLMSMGQPASPPAEGARSPMRTAAGKEENE